MTPLTAVIELSETVCAQGALILFGFGIERLQPARVQGLECLRLNLGYAVFVRVIDALLFPLSAAVTTLLVNKLGGGVIVLPASGPGLWLAIPCYVLAVDAGEYAFHRAQHRLPFLWAMHSLHHSDPAVNISTAPRHFWAEILLKSVTIYAVLGLLFKANSTLIGVYAVLGLYNYFLHMNLRVGFGPWSAWLNSPQLHRIHHSALKEHEGYNFNQFFPLFDLIFRTYRAPRIGEYPPTGLSSGETPLRLSTMLFWPWRARLNGVATERAAAVYGRSNHAQ